MTAQGWWLEEDGSRKGLASSPSCQGCEFEQWWRLSAEDDDEFRSDDGRGLLDLAKGDAVGETGGVG